MKFRARLSRDGVTQLNCIVSNLSKQGDIATLCLDDQFFRLAVQAESLDGVKAFSELCAEQLFVDYKIQSNNNNMITCEVDLQLLSRALSSGRFSSHCLIKLSKRNDKPHLTLEYSARESLVGLDVFHEIPIKLIRIDDLASISPPNINEPEVLITLNKSKSLKLLLDRYSKFSKNVSVRVQSQSRVSCRIESPNALIESFFSDMVVQNLHQQDDGEGRDLQVVVNLKKMSSVLDYGLLSYQSSTLCEFHKLANKFSF